MKKKVIIVGGGAAGITAAIAAATNGAQVMILEHKDKIGSKLFLTGNGKCNLTNLSIKLSDYCFYENEDGDFIQRILDAFPAQKIRDFFHDIGMRTHVLRDSYVYPETEAAATVVEVLERELRRLSVNLKTGVDVKKIREETDCVCVLTQTEEYYADEVILACGGASYPKTGSDGSGFSLLRDLQSEIRNPYPALTALICRNANQKMLSGLRQNAAVYLIFQGKEIAKDIGQVQFTDYGISGIPVFQISSCLIPALTAYDSANDSDYSELLKKYGDKILVKIDLFPTMTSEKTEELFETQITLYRDFPFEEAMSGLLHKKWIQYLAHKFSFSGKKAGELKKNDMMLLAKEVKGVKFPVTDLKGFDFCQITGGGLCLHTIRDDFSLKEHPRIRVIGELLNVTGKCGGYNLHWAFASGLTAGEASAKGINRN